MDEIASIREKLANQEATFKKLEEMLNSMSNVEELHPTLDEILTENEKLKYRVGILQRSLKEIDASNDYTKNSGQINDDGPEIIGIIKRLFDSAIEIVLKESKIYDHVESAICLGKLSDFQCNSSLSLVTKLKKPPNEIANEIISKVPAHPMIKSLTVSGPGFINITLNNNYVLERIRLLILNQPQPPPIEKKLKIIIDYGSPNIAKTMHVGHLRSLVIGDSLARLFRFLGHTVIPLNHLGDWGTQFGMLIAHLKECFPDFLHSPPLLPDLVAFYRESKKRFDSDETFRRNALDTVVRLQKREAEEIAAWKMICELSIADFHEIFEELDVNLIDRGESFYHYLMPTVIQELKEKNLLTEENGCTLLFVGDDKPPLLLIKSDGGFTYDTSDMAALKQRIFDEEADWILYVVDSGQALHFAAIFEAGRLAGWIKPKHRIEFIGFGVVLGEDRKKFKTRSGETICLRELLDEGLRRAMKKLCDKGRDKELSAEELKAVQRSVAYGCIKYADLCHNRQNDYVFSFDRMLDDKGNTAVYMLYSFTRIQAIIRNAKVPMEKLRTYVNSTDFIFNEELEWKLAKTILRYADILRKVSEDFLIHSLCEYLYELSVTFTEFYDNLYCVEKDAVTGKVTRVHLQRIALCVATGEVYKTCFHILGLKPLNRM